MKKLIFGVLMVLAVLSVSFAVSTVQDMQKQNHCDGLCPVDFQNLTTEEIQEKLGEELANLQTQYEACEEEQMKERIQERIQMTQDLIDNPDKIEEMKNNVPEMGERHCPNNTE